MKMLGLIGGMSWESTALYYRIINTIVKETRGDLHSARILLYSFNFEEIASLQRAGDWVQATRKMIEAGKALKAGGAEALVICTNTMHLMAQEVEEHVQLPVIHIADCTGKEISKRQLASVGLLGTEFTMQKPFYKDHIAQRFGVQVIVPEEADRAAVHRIIFQELCQGIVQPDSRAEYKAIMGRLKDRGAQGVILGCTEIALLLTEPEYYGLTMFNTTMIHAHYAAHYAMQ
jgi:aspartate racemase